MRQKTLAEGSFEKYRKKTRKEQFLAEMESVIPLKEFAAAIEPFYLTPERAGDDQSVFESRRSGV